MAKIRKGDLVQVITGRGQDDGGDRGKQGKVLRVLGDRVVVEGVNVHTKHTRAGANGQQSAGTVTAEVPIHVSNVAVLDPETHTPTRVGVRIEVVSEDGVTRTVRTRYAKNSGKDI